MAELCRDTQVTLDGFNFHRILLKGVCVFGPIVQWLGHLIFNQGI